MNSRLRLGPPKQTLPHTSGSRMRPMSLPSGFQTTTPLYELAPRERAALDFAEALAAARPSVDDALI